MSDATFYVKDVNGNLVAAQYLLQPNGQPVIDPNTSAAQTRAIYSSSGTLLAQQNVNGYLLVPADYSISNAITFAQLVANQLEVTGIGSGEETVDGLTSALGLMTDAFVPYDRKIYNETVTTQRRKRATTLPHCEGASRYRRRFRMELDGRMETTSTS